jgi:hypothetical protein
MADDSNSVNTTRTGIRTTEFWLTLVVVLAGLLPSSGLLPENHWSIKLCGLIVSAAAAIGYQVVRAGVKKTVAESNDPLFKVLAFALLLPILCVGCCSGHIVADNIEGTVGDVCTVHDGLLNGTIDAKDLNGDGVVDEKDALRKRVYLDNSKVLRAVVAEAKK